MSDRITVQVRPEIIVDPDDVNDEDVIIDFMNKTITVTTFILDVALRCSLVEDWMHELSLIHI